MAEDYPFRNLLARVRTGQGEAAEQLVRRYEPALRRVIDVRLRDPNLRRHLDEDDVCQSVLASFFVRAALGQYELDSAEDLLRLLATMARNKVANQVKRYRTDRRDDRRVEQAPVEERDVATKSPSPSRQLAAAELLEEAYRRLSPDERQVLSLRQEGRTWEEIATALGGTPDALRIRLARATKRVAEQLGLDEVS